MFGVTKEVTKTMRPRDVREEIVLSSFKGSMPFYAHSLEGKAPSEWQTLEAHLNGVAKSSADFASPFGGNEWAFLAGLWHDLGKYSPAFQKKLYDANGIEAHIETTPGRVVHSDAGAHLATLKEWHNTDRLLAWLIMGHHAGLADYDSDKSGPAALQARMLDPQRSDPVLLNVPDAIRNHQRPAQAIPKDASPAFFIRMLFSCLVDADFLDTEAFMTPEKAKKREKYPDLAVLAAKFDHFLENVTKNAQKTPVNVVRNEVLAQCRCAADLDPTVFSLTVPTGGGKTLSSMAFALRHAVKHAKSRIIYVIPYTSIIEQTVGVFRAIPGFENAVIEHHSNIALDDEDAETSRSRLAAENWDAPIIVTTAVQFFESLYACKTSRCRKLHNMVNSVVIFDEAQCLPPEFLRPCVFAIRELQRFYRVTPVLCTATQPVLNHADRFDFRFREGFEHVTEIVSDPSGLAERLKRTEIQLLDQKMAVSDQKTLLEALKSEKEAVLCIVNRKEDARTLARELPNEKTVHLSTNMCAEHRFRVFDDIKKRLNDSNEPFYVITTSLIEAGVDLDFPIVYRALAGLDSIAQAAGRCNREGKRPQKGKTVIFVPENQPQYVKSAADIAQEALSGELSAIFAPETIENYFKTRFWQLGEEKLDQFGILERLSGGFNYAYRSVAADFRLIRDDWTRPVIVPYGKALEIIDNLHEPPWNVRFLLRKLQRYTITIEKSLHDLMRQRDDIHPVHDFPNLFTLNPLFYNKKYGFIPPDEAGQTNPEDFIC
ncbi:MAG: CRISPR-associated helicase Cas3' [Spartobacteria bacterium]|nr:CRISPR-associated helicase Cas3' [Spartobacteria bacterium]